MNAYLSVLIQAAIPIWERGALPIALEIYHLPLWRAFLTALAGNIIPVIFLAFAFEGISHFLMDHFKFWHKIFTWLFDRTRAKHSKKFEKWGELTLVAIAGIPLPLFGPWSAVLAAFIFGIVPKKSIPLILLGSAVALAILAAATLSLNKVL